MERDLSDEELLGRFQQGDAGAFERLLRRHRGPLYTFAARMLGDPQRAEDVAQETFLRIVRGAGDWEARARFTTWMYTIARNLCADAARREKVRRGPGGEASGAEAAGVDDLPGDGPSPERAAESLRLRPLLLRALAALPEEQREVFVLREQAGLAFREIAQVAGVSENTAKSRMRYALEGLRRLLAEAGVGDQGGPPDAQARTR